MGRVTLALAALLTFISVFVPLSPLMPNAGLEASWMFGMNQAVAQGLIFGKEIVFTFGPYASIYTKTYHPSTDSMMVYGGLYLALSYWACFILLMRGVQARWVLIFCAVLAGLMFKWDPLLFSLPLLVALLIFRITLPGENKNKIQEGKFAPFYIAILFSTFGLLPLIKGSLLIICGALSVLCCAFFLINKNERLAAITLLSPILSMALFWKLSGQAISELPGYAIGMARIFSGYTEAMAINGDVHEIVLYALASVILMFAIFAQKHIPAKARIFLSCVYLVFLFLSFKSGFVRHDGHALISGTSILLAALLLPFVINIPRLIVVVFFSLLAWGYIDRDYRKTSTDSIGRHIQATYSSAWHGAKNRIENANWPKTQFDAAVESLRKQASFPLLPGSTDIYSHDQSYLIASGNTWSPRPVLQSYSVYTPRLAEINKAHLLGSQAPDNIIFSVQPIDGRFPPLEDGASWPALLLNYEPNRIQNKFLYLRKKVGNDRMDGTIKLLSQNYHFGERVHLPPSQFPVFVEIEIKPSMLGRLASLLLKPSQLEISAELTDGTTRKYRMIAGMAKSGFLISPLIEDTAEFGMLYGKKGYLDGKIVKSISIFPRGGDTLHWNDQYRIAFSNIRLDSPVDISKIYNFDGFDQALPAVPGNVAR